MFSTFCVNTHHDATTFELDGSVSNIKKMKFQEQSMGFPWNKKKYIAPQRLNSLKFFTAEVILTIYLMMLLQYCYLH